MDCSGKKLHFHVDLDFCAEFLKILGELFMLRECSFHQSGDDLE